MSENVLLIADCCDGLLSAATPERRLEIMRDPRLGAFGAIGLVLFLIVKVVAVASLQRLETFATAFPVGEFVLAASLSRWLIVLVALQPQARPGGMGADFARG